MNPEKTIPLTLYFPETEEDLTRLARKTSAIHAELALARIRSLPCPGRQKERLAKLVMAAVSGEVPPGP